MPLLTTAIAVCSWQRFWHIPLFSTSTPTVTTMKIMSNLLLVLAACIIIEARAADVSRKQLTLTIMHGAVARDQRVLKVEKGDVVRIIVTSDEPGILHLHGYQLEAKLDAGATEALFFTAHATGRYPFEWHRAGENMKAQSHAKQSLATLEVWPR